ncbi:hypothetical protein NDI85_21450 [Halomicroarcula sp. S1AR25-4]|uniref:hypothetical protein n=1 Tax=Haloarcula sp. S1AR25-4 TaxID=2950538 RepID=UPI0028765A20|nr:hypothetical protein [Halomicroarcula sp. S1AR25-4]MDS0280355.1 hypothetical protein [Halomicroarcula sp. S1AR25-4]
MVRVPAEFEEEFEPKGETFFAIAELLYIDPDRQYTQAELADRFDCSTQTISTHTQTMAEWLDRRDEQTTYAWDTDAHDPASTEGLAGVRQFYTDLWNLLKRHSSTTPGSFAIMGFVMFVAATVVGAFAVVFSLSITQESAIPLQIYVVIAAGSFVTGVIATLLAPFQAVVNRWLWARLPANVSQNND